MLLANGGTAAAFRCAPGPAAGRADWGGTRAAVLEMWALAALADAAAVTEDSTFALAASALFPKPTWVVGPPGPGGLGPGCRRLEETEPSCRGGAGRNGCG